MSAKVRWMTNPKGSFYNPICPKCKKECGDKVTYIESGQGTRTEVKPYLSKYCPFCGARMEL